MGHGDGIIVNFKTINWPNHAQITETQKY